jgi:hypothetical protein
MTVRSACCAEPARRTLRWHHVLYFYDYDGSWNILLANGSVLSVGAAIEPEVWPALLDRHKTLSDEIQNPFTSGPLVRRHPRWRHWIGLICFLVLSLLPGIRWCSKRPVLSP